MGFQVAKINMQELEEQTTRRVLCLEIGKYVMSEGSRNDTRKTFSVSDVNTLLASAVRDQDSIEGDTLFFFLTLCVKLCHSPLVHQFSSDATTGHFSVEV